MSDMPEGLTGQEQHDWKFGEADGQMTLLHTLGKLAALREQLAEEREAGINMKTQNRIRDLVIELSGASDGDIDGGGCDSGDPVDLSLSEICQGFAFLKDAHYAEVERLKDVLHADKTGLAAALDKCVTLAQARMWIVDGRGSYSWDDDKYRREAGWALREIIDHCRGALKASGDLAHAECCGRGKKPAERGKENPCEDS